MRDAIRIKTMRGVWQLREYPVAATPRTISEYAKEGGAVTFTEGNVTFQGSTLEVRGPVVRVRVRVRVNVRPEP